MKFQAGKEINPNLDDLFVILGVMLLEGVAGEVVVEITPDEVGVVGIVLGVGVFDDKIDALNAEVMPGISFKRASPGEVKFFALGGVDFTQGIVDDFLSLH